MINRNKDWRYHLETYGADLSRWPEDILHNLDVDRIKKSPEYMAAAELDEAYMLGRWSERLSIDMDEDYLRTHLKTRIMNACADKDRNADVALQSGHQGWFRRCAEVLVFQWKPALALGLALMIGFGVGMSTNESSTYSSTPSIYAYMSSDVMLAQVMFSQKEGINNEQ